MQKSPWGPVISWLIAFGVPMTPLAGTWLGYGMIGIAGIISMWRGWVWINQQNWSPSAIRWVVLIPTFLLILIAGLWSYYGGLPALIVSDRARASSHLLKIVNYQPFPFEEGKEARINMFLRTGTESIRFRLTYKAFLVTNPPAMIDQLRQTEKEFWAVIMTPQNVPEQEVTMPPDTEMFITLRGPILTAAQSTAIQSGKQVALFVMGIAKYSDGHGRESGATEFCLGHPASTQVLHFCQDHNGPAKNY